MRPFDYYKPKDFQEAIALLSQEGKKTFPVAGATDLIPMARDERWLPDIVVDIKALPGLRELKLIDEGLYVGAAMTMNEIAASPLVKSTWDVLAQGASSVGHNQVRNRATVGGNIATSSPAADTPPSLLVLEAIVVVRGPEGERRIPITEFFLGPRRNALKKGEIIVGLILPTPPEGAVGSYHRISRRHGADLAIVGVAVLAYPKAEGFGWRVALGAVAPTPIRVPQAEATLSAAPGKPDEAVISQAIQEAVAASRPIDDIRATAKYRREMIATLMRKAIEDVLEKL